MRQVICMTLNCVIPAQFSVIQTINRNVGLKCFLFIYQNVCLLLSLYIHILFIFYEIVSKRIYSAVGYIIIYVKNYPVYNSVRVTSWL